MSESKPERFRRVVEARVNKIIKMVRLLGNCSNVNVYTFTTEQVQQIFATLQDELDRAKMLICSRIKNAVFAVGRTVCFPAEISDHRAASAGR